MVWRFRATDDLVTSISLLSLDNAMSARSLRTRDVPAPPAPASNRARPLLHPHDRGDAGEHVEQAAEASGVMVTNHERPLSPLVVPTQAVASAPIASEVDDWRAQLQQVLRVQSQEAMVQHHDATTNFAPK